jgi:hypothetical protein
MSDDAPLLADDIDTVVQHIRTHYAAAYVTGKHRPHLRPHIQFWSERERGVPRDFLLDSQRAGYEIVQAGQNHHPETNELHAYVQLRRDKTEGDR